MAKDKDGHLADAMNSLQSSMDAAGAELKGHSKSDIADGIKAVMKIRGNEPIPEEAKVMMRNMGISI